MELCACWFSCTTARSQHPLLLCVVSQASRLPLAHPPYHRSPWPARRQTTRTFGVDVAATLIVHCFPTIHERHPRMKQTFPAAAHTIPVHPATAHDRRHFKNKALNAISGPTSPHVYVFIQREKNHPKQWTPNVNGGDLYPHKRNTNTQAVARSTSVMCSEPKQRSQQASQSPSHSE